MNKEEFDINKYNDFDDDMANLGEKTMFEKKQNTVLLENDNQDQNIENKNKTVLLEDNNKEDYSDKDKTVLLSEYEAKEDNYQDQKSSKELTEEYVNILKNKENRKFSLNDFNEDKIYVNKKDNEKKIKIIFIIVIVILIFAFIISNPGKKKKAEIIECKSISSITNIEKTI